MSVRSEKIASPANEVMSTILAAQSTDSALGEANGYNVASPENPLTRTVVVSIKASLNDMCLQKSRATWAPSQEALRSIYQQRKFTSLDGAAEQLGDLKSIVLHSMKLNHVKSTFPMSLGAKITGVDDATFSSTGEAFSTIVLPNAESTREKNLQSDDVSLAYEFAKKFPGYTASNLSEKGVHEVSQRRFVLVSADHPIVSAISVCLPNLPERHTRAPEHHTRAPTPSCVCASQENADKLQMGEISVRNALLTRPLPSHSSSLDSY